MASECLNQRFLGCFGQYGTLNLNDHRYSIEVELRDSSSSWSELAAAPFFS